MAEQPKYYPPTAGDFGSITDIVGAFLNRLSSGKPAYMMSGQNLQNYKESGAKSMDEYKKLVSEGKAIPPGGDSVIEPSAPAPAGLDLARPKPFAMTPEGQFERYFKTPEFDYVFGAKARGEAAPKSVGEMQAMGSELKAPEGKDALPAYYASQSAMGRVNLEDIQNMYHSQGRSDLAAWAAANPMLAQREYMKTLKQDFPHRGEGEEIIEAYGGGAPGEGEEIIDAYNFMRNKANLKK